MQHLCICNIPSVLGICNGWARERILHISLTACFAGVDGRSALLSRTVQILREELHIAVHQRVVSVTICALIATSDFDAGEVDKSGEDQVGLTPVSGSRVFSGDSMLRLCVEEGVTDAQLMMTEL